MATPQNPVTAPQVDYEDERFAQVEADKQQALTELEQTYGGMIGQTDQYYQAQIDAAKQWSEKQQQLQQERTDFTIEQVQQQKQQAYKDYTKEQSGAYTDWKKQSDAYGVQSEQLAGAGLKNTGFSESSQVAMYTAYQNRVAVARDAHARAVLNYDNAIKEAQLQNNSALAEIAYNALQKELELSLAGFQYKNTLVLEQANKKVELENTYYNRYMDVLNQINYENEQAEQIRQYEQTFAEQQRQYDQSFAEDVRQYNQSFEEQMRQFDLEYQENVRQFNQEYQMELTRLDEQIRQYNQTYQLQVNEYKEGIRQFNEEIARLKAKDAQENKIEIQRLEQQKKALEQEQKQFEAEAKLKQQQLNEEKRQFEESQKLKKQQMQLDSQQKTNALQEEKRQFDAQMKLQKEQAAKKTTTTSSSSGSSTKKTTSSSGTSTVKKTTSSSTTKKSNTTSNTTSNKVTIDTKSLSAVGLPVMTSETKLAAMVASGELNVKQVGNKLVFSRGSQPKGQAALNKYTTLTTRAIK